MSSIIIQTAQASSMLKRIVELEEISVLDREKWQTTALVKLMKAVVYIGECLGVIEPEEKETIDWPN